MDVEHWRPKAVVRDRLHGGQAKLRGYPWFATGGRTCCPSCIDCNRQRTQNDALTGVEETAGKANQFPVNGARMTPPKARRAPPIEEDALC